MNIEKPKNYALGSSDVKAFPKKQYEKIEEIIDSINTINSDIDTLNDNVHSLENAIVTESVSGVNTIVEKRTATAFNTSGTITPAQLATGYITSTSAATVTLTLPTATELATELGASGGTSFEFIVNNSAGANTVTVAINTGITAATPVVTGGGTLTVSVANGIGIFRIVFVSGTVARLFRIG
jgi:hypothetical protein